MGSKDRAETSSAPAIDMGISDTDRARIAEGVSRVLADSYTLYLKTHAFHWNVEGPMFNTLHLMFMAQYTELWTALDLIAERIRSLGFPAPGTYKEFAKLASIEETEGVPDAMEMVQLLADDQEKPVKDSEALFKAAESAGDQGTCDLAVRRMQAHQKNAWMLRSQLG
jgi:starvation-inducible DNA-binding protein